MRYSIQRLSLSKSTHMFKRTPLIIFVTFLVLFNTLLNSFATCCESDKELLFNSEERGCCTCCNTAADTTFRANPSSGTSALPTDDCHTCLCIPYASTSDNYFVLNKHTILAFLFSPALLAVSLVENNAHTPYHTFSPTVVDQMTECLSTVVLLV